MKIFTKCKKEKKLSEFGKHKKSKDGLNWWCKGCQKEYDNGRLEIKKLYNQKRASYYKEYYILHKEKYIEQNKVWRQNSNYYSPESYEKRKLYEANPEVKVRRRIRERQREKDLWKNNVNYKLKKLLRSRLRRVIRSHKIGSFVQDLGCSIEQLRTHIESKWIEGMSWDNQQVS